MEDYRSLGIKIIELSSWKVRGPSTVLPPPVTRLRVSSVPETSRLTGNVFDTGLRGPKSKWRTRDDRGQGLGTPLTHDSHSNGGPKRSDGRIVAQKSRDDSVDGGPVDDE